MHIPVEFGARVEVVVYSREEEARENGRDDDVYEVVEGEGKQYFVDVQWKCLERDVIGKGFGTLPQPLWAVEREWIAHIVEVREDCVFGSKSRNR